MNWLDDRDRERHRYMCPICGWANDPLVYSMKKFNGKWYHTICLEKALYYFMERYEFKLGEHLKFLSCEKKDLNGT